MKFQILCPKHNCRVEPHADVTKLDFDWQSPDSDYMLYTESFFCPNGADGNEDCNDTWVLAGVR